MELKFKGNGLVWDKEKNKVLARFENGEYVTSVKREQTILEKLGFESEEIKEEANEKEEPQKKDDK